jgi:hypothetical protein
LLDAGLESCFVSVVTSAPPVEKDPKRFNEVEHQNIVKGMEELEGSGVAAAGSRSDGEG